MSRTGTILAAAAGLVTVLALAAGGVFAWATSATNAALAKTYDVHGGDFPIPAPLTEAELAELRAEALAKSPPAAGAEATDPLAGVDLAAVALERAVARGGHLVQSRYICVECHGQNFGGGTMIDDPAIGTVLGPNLTTGKGGVTASYTAADWDRKVRHGVNPAGLGGFMPSEDYLMMSDQELADIVSYIRAQPPVDNEVPPLRAGPVGKLLIATGQLPLAAERLPQSDRHEALPPPTADTVEFGRHMAGVCTGCHRAQFEGGPMVGAPPDWKVPANLTPGPDGLAGWTYEDFEKVMRSGIRKDGTPVGLPMNTVVPYSARMTDVEMRALWTFIQSLPPLADGT